MTKSELIENCSHFLGAEITQPFEDDTESYIARHGKNKKWFALITTVKGRDIVNVKLDPSESDFLRGQYEGITSGWHMNKTHWSTIYLDSNVPQELIMELAEKSYELTRPKAAKRTRASEQT